MADLALPIENGAYAIEAGSILAQLGLTEIANYLEDDWEDGSLTGRVSTDDGVFVHPDANEAGDVLIGRYRPEWVIASESSSITVSSGSVTLAGNNTDPGDIIATSCTLTSGRWFRTFSFESTGATGGSYDYSILAQDIQNVAFGRAENSYFLRITEQGLQDFQRNEGGTTTELVGATWTEDTNSHTDSISRNSYGNFEIFLDNSSQGTTTDTTYTNSNATLLGNNGSAGVTMTNMEVR